MPLLHPLEPALLGRLEALALDGVDVDDDRAVGVERPRAWRSAVTSWPSIGPDVGEVELLEEEPGRGVGLDRGLDLGAQLLDPSAEAERQLREPLLDLLAGVVEAAG